MKILKASQMAAVDRKSTELYSIPSMLLMENAGRSVVQEIAKACPELARKRIYIFCGKGNNGGDGLVVARHLIMAGSKPEIFLHFEPSLYRGDAQLNWNIVQAMGLPVRILPEGDGAESMMKSLPIPDIIIDALFGTGLTKALSGDLLRTIRWINGQAEKAFIAAVDIPSGLFADAPEIPGEAIHAHLTVTFAALKPALVFPPASDLAGKVIVVPIGSPDALLDLPEHFLELIDCEIVRRALSPRARDAHKGDFGHVHIVAGSRGKSGAALMSGLAALRSGAGLVTLWLPHSLQSDIVGKIPELMTESLPETSEGTAAFEGFQSLSQVFPHASVLVIGPGLTTHESTKRLVRQLVKTSTVPVVLDADGLNAFAGNPEALRNLPGQPVVITPHPGEMARLLSRSIQDIQSHRIESALLCAQQYGCHTILKGCQTIIASPGGCVMVNCTGNPGMATGGSGDILAGMTGRFVAGWNRKHRELAVDALMDYLAAAVYLHGLAADLASEEKGVESLIATDLLPYLPQAFKRISNS